MVGRKTLGMFGTGEFEWYTPAEVIEPSSRGARRHQPQPSYVADCPAHGEGHAVPHAGRRRAPVTQWHGRTWLNPPFAQPTDPAVRGQAGRRDRGRPRDGRHRAHQRLHRHAVVPSPHLPGAGRRASRKVASGSISPRGDFSAPTRVQLLFYFGDAVELFESVFGEACSVLRGPAR